MTRRFLRKSVDGVVWTPSVKANWQSANRELFDECIADYRWEADRESSSVVIQFNSIELRRSLRKDQVIDNLGEFASTIPVIDVVLGSPNVPGDLIDSTEGVIETINDLLTQILSCPRRRVALLERTLVKSD